MLKLCIFFLEFEIYVNPESFQIVIHPLQITCCINAKFGIYVYYTHKVSI